MQPLPILIYPHEALITPTKKVGDIQTLQILIDAMIASMHRSEGVGLAATQVGQNLRLCVLEHQPDGNDDPLEPVPLQVLANAKIISRTGGKETVKEGCLSLPGIEVPVTRSVKIKVRGQDRDGNQIQFRATGFHARIVQHELDHLDGILIIDHAKQPHRVVRDYLQKQA
mgnify:CR=1 FL=1